MEIIRNSVDAMVADANRQHEEGLQKEINLAQKGMQAFVKNGMFDEAEKTLRTTLKLHGVDKETIEAQVAEFRKSAKRTQAGATPVTNIEEGVKVVYESGKEPTIKLQKQWQQVKEAFQAAFRGRKSPQTNY
jgi:hypothetical protein